ncbi:zinc ribbon domain-containing protein [Jonesiaceae bacterium BS-20]|uniref:Zinc ribbon domain-containing protein n=1 Tax=Jonesiaceae bacterium BS-20 TaxID=3120821 RepID=A0AAU7DU86_9MICO
MILYDFVCQTGHIFEAGVASMVSPNPPCPVCHATSSRRPSRVNFGGQAGTGISRENMPKSWRATRGGDKETVAHWHKVATEREKLEEKHPELAGDRRPVLAHEGIFAKKPLRAGDDIAKSVGAAITADKAATMKRSRIEQ